MSHLELLSPAGNAELALAAFAGGADAVYCGLGRFNARERAENFTAASLGQIIRYAHENDKKVYVTFNTLIFENELGAMFDALALLAELEPDALIVQDPGVVMTVRKYFPELTLHGSTQMGIHNSAGVAAAAKIGLKRVILERQMTLDEVKSVAASTPLELEVFIHGSLCCSLSGRCLLSEKLCGASGNRGQCRQLCRKLYTPEGKKPGYWLSPEDLDGSNIIDELRKINISSLKIEGRLRTPDYVWKTARAYRMLIDNPHDITAQKEAETLLHAALGRVSGKAFYDPGNWKELIRNDISGAFGRCVAVVKKSLRHGVAVEVTDGLHLGDRLRIGSDGESFSLTAMEKLRDKRILKARRGEVVFLPGTFRAKSGEAVLRIGENGFDFSRQAATLPPWRQRVRISLTASAEQFSGQISGVNGCWVRETAFAPAQKHPLSCEEVKKVFGEGAPDGFAAGEVTVELRGDFFVPAAELKALRRDFWDFFRQKLQYTDLHPELAAKRTGFAVEYTRSAAVAPAAVTVPDKAFMIPAFIPEKDLPLWRKKVALAYERGVRDFSVAHWHGFTLLTGFPETQIYVDFPFPIANSQALLAAKFLGADFAGLAPETPAETREAIGKHAVIPIFSSKSDVPLLVTRLTLPAGKWLDRNGNEFHCMQKENLSFLYLKT